MRSEMKDFLRKIDSGNVEVEDILDLARHGVTEDAKILEELSERMGWLDLSGAEGSNAVPLKEWVNVVASYIRDGESGLGNKVFSAGSFRVEARFVIGLLEYLHTTESSFILVRIFDVLLRDPDINMCLSRRLCRAFNEIFSFEPKVTLDVLSENKVREFLHKLLLGSPDEDFRGLILCALRNFGDESSIKLIKSGPKLSGKWAGVDAMAIKVIKKRVAASL